MNLADKTPKEAAEAIKAFVNRSFGHLPVDDIDYPLEWFRIKLEGSYSKEWKDRIKSELHKRHIPYVYFAEDYVEVSLGVYSLERIVRNALAFIYEGTSRLFRLPRSFCTGEDSKTLDKAKTLLDDAIAELESLRFKNM